MREFPWRTGKIHVEPVGYAIPLNPAFETTVKVIQTGMEGSYRKPAVPAGFWTPPCSNRQAVFRNLCQPGSTKE